MEDYDGIEIKSTPLNNFLIYSIGVGMVVFFLYQPIEFEYHHSITKGTITALDHDASGLVVIYEYYIDGKLYKSDNSGDARSIPKIGNSVTVEYHLKDFERSRIIFDYSERNTSLCKIH